MLIANTSARGGTIKLTALFEDGTTPVTRTMEIGALRRSTVFMRETFPEVVGKRFSVFVESMGDAPVDLVVDHSIYWTTSGITWDIGTSAPATRIR